MVQHLVGTVEQGEDVPLLHGDLAGALLLVVVQGQHQFLPRLVVSGGHLLLWLQRINVQSLSIHFYPK